MFRTLVLAAIIFASASCGDDVGNSGTAVGGPCSSNVDCSPQSRCVTSGDFPGGTCAINCASHEDCPFGTRCVSKEDGICLLQCEVPADCRGGYSCKGESNASGGGDSLVCIDD